MAVGIGSLGLFYQPPHGIVVLVIGIVEGEERFRIGD
jgi:hypothetical protein